MEDSNVLNNEEISQFIKEANDKLDKFTLVLEKFGLDIITKMGQTNSKINMLTDKINELNKATIEIKSLTPQLTNIIENQKIFEAELDLIRSLVQKSNISFRPKEIVNEEVERDTSATIKKQSIINQLNDLKNKVYEINEPEPVIERLENIKEDIFIFKGGHRILYEIAQFMKKLEGLDTFSEDLKESIKEKIVFWINKL
ncbi:hypothetical protein LCGC14_2427020 [marine sediment metagenome]|uniref:Uncharacterized protein n=1 Tax=marine sediment metagenome TaxID=412755 RepID=A0A0F9E044_9ZZZZ